MSSRKLIVGFAVIAGLILFSGNRPSHCITLFPESVIESESGPAARLTVGTRIKIGPSMNAIPCTGQSGYIYPSKIYGVEFNGQTTNIYCGQIYAEGTVRYIQKTTVLAVKDCGGRSIYKHELSKYPVPVSSTK